MAITINQKQKKKESEDASVLQSGANTGSNIKSDEEIPAWILNMSDDDPRLVQFMEEVEEERRRRHPNQTHDELMETVEATLETRNKT